MLAKLFVAFPLLFFSTLCERILNAAKYNCHPKTLVLIVCNYTIMTIFSTLMAIKMNFERRRFPRPWNAIVPLIFLVCVCVFLVFNFYGFGWFLDELLSSQRCVRRFDLLFLTIIFTMLLFILIGGIVFVIWALVQRRNQRLRQQFFEMHRDPEIIKNDLIRRNLNSIYANPGILGRANAVKFVENSELGPLMIKLPLVGLEKRLFKQHFMEVLGEERLTELQEREAGNCSVCFLDLEKEQSVYHFDCAHWFHENCLEEWMRIKVNCPSCRANLRLWLVKRLYKEKESAD